VRKPKINWKRLFKLLGYGFGVIAFFVSLGFTEHRRNAMPCKQVVVHVSDSLGNSFIEENDVLQMLYDKIGNPEGNSLESINISVLEKIIDNNPFVLKSEVFSTLDGKLVLQVRQRTPIVRIINSAGENFYIDEQGVLMPISDKYSARVPVANGKIIDRESEQKIRQVRESEVEDTSFHANVLEKIFVTANYIRSHEFWNAQIEQIYVNADGDIELIPLVGNQTIVFGDADRVTEKFEKLYRFYKQGLNKTGWNQYNRIDLRFKDQVVCTKMAAANGKTN
jgi:cell division protein FtsQ